MEAGDPKNDQKLFFGDDYIIFRDFVATLKAILNAFFYFIIESGLNHLDQSFEKFGWLGALNVRNERANLP